MMNRRISGLVVFAIILFIIGCKSQSNPQLPSQTTPPENNQSLSYLALGDSYTIGESVPDNKRWPVQLAGILRNNGIAIDDPRIIAKTGWTTLDLTEAIDDNELNPPYDFVSLLIGVNDQYGGLNFEKYHDRFRYLLKKSIELADGQNDHVLVVSIPDYSVTPFGQARDPEKISRELKKYNATNKSIAENLDVHYVNITPVSQEAVNDESLIASDELHPSGKMYNQWVEKIAPIILPEIESWSNESND